MKIIIVDDDRIVCQALSTILSLEGDIQVLALGQDAGDALRLYQEHRPDIALLDIRMGEKSGLDAAQQILALDGEARILFLTTFSDEEYILKALSIGAKGYLLKQDYEQIAPALRAVMGGQSVFGDQVVQQLPQLLKASSRKRMEGLSPREADILRLVAKGQSNKEIAATLFLSEGTVRNYLSALLQKLDLRDRTQLVVWYYQDKG